MLIDEKFNQVAISMGTLLAQNKYTIVFGGGSRGLMGAAAKAALENDGIVYGFIPSFLLAKEGHNSNLDHLEIVDSMHIRKQKMADSADAFIVLPGGFGTLDELFEIITWRQLSIHQKPIIVVNSYSYWDPLKVLFNNVIENKFALPEHCPYVTFVSTPQEAVDYLISQKKPMT